MRYYFKPNHGILLLKDSLQQSLLPLKTLRFLSSFSLKTQGNCLIWREWLYKFSLIPIHEFQRSLIFVVTWTLKELHGLINYITVSMHPLIHIAVDGNWTAFHAFHLKLTFSAWAVLAFQPKTVSLNRSLVTQSYHLTLIEILLLFFPITAQRRSITEK